MNSKSILYALKSLRPGAIWSLNGNTYEGLIWQDSTPKPTYEEIVQEWDRIKDEIAWEPVRNKREQLLKETDWVGLSDVNISNKQAWLDYRQALRDIPQTFAKPEDVIWPVKP